MHPLQLRRLYCHHHLQSQPLLQLSAHEHKQQQQQPAAAAADDTNKNEQHEGSRGLYHRGRRRGGLWPCQLLLWILLLRAADASRTGTSYPGGGASHTQQPQQHARYSTSTVRTRYGVLRGVVARSPGSDTKVEIYLGVPYATAPLGSLRYMPPVTPTPWRGTRLADAPAPACPQKTPDAADPNTPRLLREYLERIGPHVANQSEDCLYLNLYVPRPPASAGSSSNGHANLPLQSTITSSASAAAAAAAAAGSGSSGNNGQDLLPALLFIHGDSYSWGSGNPLDGTALAARGRLIVVSINFRLGILGFLKTSPKGSAQGNYGLMDLVAGVQWLKENLPAFGGDANRLTLMGHGTGAALANFLAVSPMTKELVDRVVLLGGSALSPWAVQREPLTVKRRVSEILNCPGDPDTEDLAPCLRLKSVEELLAVKLDVPRFTAGYAPFVDGALLPTPSTSNNQNLQPSVTPAGLLPVQLPGPGSEFANFRGNCDVLMGLTSDEAWFELTEQDLEYGLNETRRDRILRTYVRNTYRYHLHEIYSTLRNEYTDWERGEPSPLIICEGLLDLLSDGQVGAPLLRLALLHSAAGGRGYFLHFQPGERPSRRAEDLPYFLGLPLAEGNHSATDEGLSRLMLHYLANFVRRGDPNGAQIPLLSSGRSSSWGSSAPDIELTSSPPFWDSYDSINQFYLEAGHTTEMRTHYRGHKMSLWLNLLPQLHRPGYEISMRHHHLAENPVLYEGSVRPQSMAMPVVPSPQPPPQLPSPTEITTPSTSVPSSPGVSSTPASVPAEVTGTDCAPNLTSSGGGGGGAGGGTTALPPSGSPTTPGPNNLLRKLASSHYQTYTKALTYVIVIGVALLLINITMFALILGYCKGKSTSEPSFDPCTTLSALDKKKDDTPELGYSGSGLHDSSTTLHTKLSGGSHTTRRSLSTFLLDTPSGSDRDSPMTIVTSHKTKSFVEELEHLQLQDYNELLTPSSAYYCTSPSQRMRTPSPCVDATMAAAVGDMDLDEELPDPPPPPKSPAPAPGMLCPGILRQPGTPGSTKKRVQIQEISV